MSDVVVVEKLDLLVQELSKLPQVPCPVKHHFAPHVYVREVLMPAGAIVIGKIHKTEHLNIMEKGAMWLVDTEGKSEFVRAPLTFVSKAGVQKGAYIVEDVIWKTIHVTDTVDLRELELELTEGPAVLDKPMELLT